MTASRRDSERPSPLSRRCRGDRTRPPVRIIESAFACACSSSSEGSLDSSFLGSHILDDNLSTEIKSPQSHPAQSHTHSQPRRGNDAVGPQAPEVGKEPADAGREPDHLPAEAPYASPDDSDPLHQSQHNPGGAELDDGADRSRIPYIKRQEANSKQEEDHLSREREYREVEKRQGE